MAGVGVTITAVRVFVFCRDAKILLIDENKQNHKNLMIGISAVMTETIYSWKINLSVLPGGQTLQRQHCFIQSRILASIKDDMKTLNHSIEMYPNKNPVLQNYIHFLFLKKSLSLHVID